MGCGGNSGAMNMQGQKIVVHGDLYNTDTRNVLTVLEMTEVDYAFKENNRSAVDKAMGDNSTFSTDYIAKVVPVLEESNGIKRIGSGQQILEYVCYKDQRNAPKLDEKGKLIKVKKGTKPAVSLVPKDCKMEI